MSNFPESLMDSNEVDNLDKFGRELVHKYCGHVDLNTKMLNVGAFAKSNNIAINPHRKFWNMDYHVLNIEGDPNPKFIHGDITNCPQIKDNTFDFVYSLDTFEHISKPWLAANEIARILKPRGVCYIITLFAWRYHKAPEDYFRYTPFGLMSLFEGKLMHREANWDKKTRRGLNGIGIQGDGSANDIVPVDMLGAWRENWRVYYFGQKQW